MANRKGASSIFAMLFIAACGGGGGGSLPSSNPAVSPPPPSAPVAQSTDPTQFSEEAILRGISYSSGYTTDLNGMVRQFAGGGAIGDVDGDGDLDIFIVPGNTGPNLLYLNQDGSGFVEDAASAGLAYTKSAIATHRQSGPVFGDLDGDGDLDLFLGGLEGDPSQVFRNDGFGQFTDVTSGSGFDFMSSPYTISAALGDYDGDGDLDLAMAHWGTPRDQNNPGETETLWRNDSTTSTIRFTAVSRSAGISEELGLDRSGGALGEDHDYTFAPGFADIDGDGDQDLLSVADFGSSRVFLNNGDGTFTNITDPTRITDTNGMGAAIGDYDGDGDLDWFVSSIDGNRLYRNTGGNFDFPPEAIDVAQGDWGWGSCFADFNADGRLDIYQTNGWDAENPPANSTYVDDASKLWMSNADGSFNDMASVSNMLDREQGRGVICDDFDADGDVDVLLLTLDDQQAALFWTNELTDAKTLSVELNGTSPNTYAVGAIISATVGTTTQTRLVGVNSNFISHNSTIQYFGFGDATMIDTLRVEWPDGAVTEQSNVTTNQRLTLRHPDL
ncbi:MAG: CRTAC1 family protein [Hyphomonadaceae bacterium]|nr:CRTAC1 family protein [Hyphomonadaceae bacterium]